MNTTTDMLTEMLVGHDGAIRMPAKLVLRPGETEDIGRQIGLWGAAICPPQFCPLIDPRSEGHNEMWEGEIILLPFRKYTSKMTMEKNGCEGHAFAGLRADQMLVRNYYAADCWGTCYFESKDGGQAGDSDA